MSRTLPPAYFERLYGENADPWNFATSEYEAEKYRQTLSALPRARYGNAFEIGCSIGVLTAQLAGRCGHLLSVDVSEDALRQARERCANLPNVAFEKRAVPAEYPDRSFDLTVLSEVGYYLNFPDLARLADLIAAHTNPRGQLLLVHWLPVVPDYPLTGDQVHDFFLCRPQWTPVSSFRAQQYRIEVLELADPTRAE